jgi:MinD-like ATPase involved in chromosome partitioning or flagellar assembly
MDGIQFADGFDAPDRLAFGLGAPQLITVVSGVLLAFLIAHVPLPGALTVPAAAGVALLSAALAWLRFAGRSALEWAWLAGRHLAHTRQGTLEVAPRPGVAPSPAPLEPHRAGALGAPPPRSNIIALPARGRSVGRAAPAQPSPRLHGGAHRIVFFSLKGGTGRTTLSTEVAVWLAGRQGAGGPVALIDVDVRSACVAARLGLSHSGIVEYALASPDERRLDGCLVRHACGLDVLLGSSGPTNPEWPVTPAVLREVLRELDLAGAATVIVDVSPELNNLTRAALRAADDVLVVVVPTSSGIQDAYRTTEQLRRLGLRQQLGYVVNRSRGGIDVSVAMNDLGGELLAEIPEDPAIVDAENRHEPAVLCGGSAAAFELRRLVARIRPEPHAAAR